MHPIIDPETDDPHDSQSGAFIAENILHDECEESPGNYWNSKDGTSAKIILDYGCNIDIKTVQLKNSQGSSHGAYR